jgi:hypothetical protein
VASPHGAVTTADRSHAKPLYQIPAYMQACHIPPFTPHFTPFMRFSGSNKALCALFHPTKGVLRLCTYFIRLIFPIRHFRHHSEPSLWKTVDIGQESRASPHNFAARHRFRSDSQKGESLPAALRTGRAIVRIVNTSHLARP